MPWFDRKATWVSSSAISMYWPLPVTARCAIAAHTAIEAYMPVMMSTIGTPTRCGPPPGRSSRSPVTLISPPIPWAMKS